MIIERARQKNPKAFAAWTKAEERELEAEYRRGMPLEAIADMHGRSRRAIELRLDKLGPGPRRPAVTRPGRRVGCPDQAGHEDQTGNT